MRFYRLFLLAFFLLPSTANTQPVSAADSQIYVALGEYAGLDPNGFHMKRFKQFSPSESNIFENSKQLGTVIKHLRFNKGRALPEPKKREERIKEVIDKIFAEEMESQGFITGPSQEDLVVPRIVPCLGSSTKKVSVDTSKTKKDSVNFDWLFLRDTAPPRKLLRDFFGKNISILRVKDDKASAAGLAAQGLQVKCLPTRFRGTKDKWYRHEGEDALKNYEDDLDGKGKLHEYIGQNKSKFY